MQNLLVKIFFFFAKTQWMYIVFSVLGEIRTPLGENMNALSPINPLLKYYLGMVKNVLHVFIT